MLALDTETTGLDPWHGCRPFYVSTVDHNGRIRCWEWDVDPKTRTPNIPHKDLKAIQKLLDEEYQRAKKDDEYGFVLHNAKFDIRMLEVIGIRWPSWDHTHDTAIASHALASQEWHRLKDLAKTYCGIPSDDEDELREAVQVARRFGRKKGWRIAKANDPHWPAMKQTPKGKQGGDSWWACDMWLPRAVAKYRSDPANSLHKDSTANKTKGSKKKPKNDDYDPAFKDPEHPYWSVCGKYGTTDAERTILLWGVFREALHEEDLWEQYDTRRKLLKISYDIESRGITSNRQALETAITEYKERSERARRVCISLADDQIDNLNSPKQLQAVLFCKWNVPVERETKTGYSTRKEDLEATLPMLNERSAEYHFIKNLLLHRKLDKAVDYLEGYLQSALPVNLPTSLNDLRTRHSNTKRPIRTVGDAASVRSTVAQHSAGKSSDYLRLHPNFNITGTDTTRFSSNNPNAQNIAKQEGFNLRRVFGPLPGREWFSIDYENIEMRIPAFHAQEKALMKLFEEGGSYHLLVASILRPDEFRRLGPDKFKKTDAYRWIKNGNFAKQYGGQRAKVDATFKVAGAFDKLDAAMPKVAALAQYQVDHANEHGYVITLGGYRLECPRNEWNGQVKPTTPFNYWTQGSAGWAMIKALIRVSEYLDRLNECIRYLNDNCITRNKVPHLVTGAARGMDPTYGVVMTIHDELDFDFPIHKNNKTIILECKRLMELSSDDLGVPLVASVNWLPQTWSQEKSLTEWRVAA